MKEVWKPVSGFEGIYEISNKGRLKSLPKIRTGISRSGHPTIRKYKERISGPYKGSRYQIVSLFKDGKAYPHLMHRLVASHFIPNPDNLPEVNHKDGNKTNNNSDNLEWTDRAGNSIHSTRVLGKNIGSKASNVILNEEEVMEIVFKIQKGMTQAEVASEYGVSRSTVSKIMQGRNWNHVTGFCEGGCQDVRR